MLLFFIKTLMNVDQIYSCLLKLKVNFHIGPNSNYLKKTLSKVTKLMLSLYFRKSSFIYWKKTAAPPPPRKSNGLAVFNKKNQV